MIKPKRAHPSNDTSGIFLRNSVYWLRYSRNGKQIRVSLKTSDLPQALTRAKAERNRIPLDPAENLLASSARYLREQVAAGRLAPRYAGEVKARLAALLEFHPDIRELEDITPGRLQAYLDHVGKRRSAATLNTYAGQLRGLCRLFMERKHLRSNPMEEVRLPAFHQAEHARTRTLDGATARELIRSCKDPRLKFVLLAGFCLGMRRNEITEARWGWFDLAGRVCLIPPEARKRSKAASPPLNSETIEHLKEMRAALKEKPLPEDYILEPDKEPGANRYRWDFIRPFRELMKQHRVKCSPHDMRRSYCTNAVRNGATLEQLSAWVGDTPRVLADHYSHLRAYDSLVEKILR